MKSMGKEKVLTRRLKKNCFKNKKSKMIIKKIKILK
jgi:hypothetical protein